MAVPMKKGSFQYIKRRKKRQCILSLIMFAIAFGLFVLGLFLNGFDKANVFTVLAVLSILPSAKMLISFIILVPFHSVSKQNYDEVCQAVDDGVLIFADVVFTSPEKIMNLDFLVIDHNYIIGYTSASKHVKYMQEYIKEGITRRELQYQVEIYEDFERFKKRISKLSLNKEQKDKNYEEMMSYIQSLMV